MSNVSNFEEYISMAFEMAGLPEVQESELEPGTYTNAQIAEIMMGEPLELFYLLCEIADEESIPIKRKVLSTSVSTYTKTSLKYTRNN